jgi:hypothetical protein
VSTLHLHLAGQSRESPSRTKADLLQDRELEFDKKLVTKSDWQRERVSALYWVYSPTVYTTGSLYGPGR